MKSIVNVAISYSGQSTRWFLESADTRGPRAALLTAPWTAGRTFDGIEDRVPHFLRWIFHMC